MYQQSQTRVINTQANANTLLRSQDKITEFQVKELHEYCCEIHRSHNNLAFYSGGKKVSPPGEVPKNTYELAAMLQMTCELAANFVGGVLPERAIDGINWVLGANHLVLAHSPAILMTFFSQLQSSYGIMSSGNCRS